MRDGLLQRQDQAAQQRLRRVKRLRAYSPLLAQPHLKVITARQHSVTTSWAQHQLVPAVLPCPQRSISAHSQVCHAAHLMLPQPAEPALHPWES